MEVFTKTVNAINDETRVMLLDFINKNGRICVCKIEKSFNMTQSRISRHLKILKEAGFLNLEREGKWAFYSIKSPLNQFHKSILKEINCLNLNLPKVL